MVQIRVPVFFPKVIFHGLCLPLQLLGSCVVSPGPQDLQLKLPVGQGPSFPQLNPMIKNQLVPGREIPFLTLQWEHLENHHRSALVFLISNSESPLCRSPPRTFSNKSRNCCLDGRGAKHNCLMLIMARNTQAMQLRHTQPHDLN